MCLHKESNLMAFYKKFLGKDLLGRLFVNHKMPSHGFTQQALIINFIDLTQNLKVLFHYYYLKIIEFFLF